MGKRLKTYKRLFQQYKLLGFRTPWQVLMTADIIEETVKLDLVHLLEKATSGPVKPMITSCAIRVLYRKNMEAGNKDPNLAKAIERAKSFERCRCGHLMDADPLPEMECLLSQVDVKGGGNKRKYCVATQDAATRQRLRAIPAVPLIYCNRSVIIIEPLSAATTTLRQREELVKYRGGIIGRSRPGKRKREEDGSDDEEPRADGSGDDEQDAESVVADGETASPEQKKKKRQHGPKGPNPLSMKKPKKKVDGEKKTTESVLPEPGDSAGQPKAKRKRRKKNKGSGGDDVGEAGKPDPRVEGSTVPAVVADGVVASEP